MAVNSRTLSLSLIAGLIAVSCGETLSQSEQDATVDLEQEARVAACTVEPSPVQVDQDYKVLVSGMPRRAALTVHLTDAAGTREQPLKTNTWGRASWVTQSLVAGAGKVVVTRSGSLTQLASCTFSVSPPPAACGDGTCNGSESCDSCSSDCGACAPPPGAQMPDSEINYPGASATRAFVAMEPYVLNIQGVSGTVSLGGASRSHDFGGAAPFVNPATGKSDPSVFQAWSNGLIDWYGNQITNSGVPGRISKQTYGSEAVTMIKYNAGDDIAYEKCRTKVGAYPIPPRTHVRWELEVAFGKADGVNDWVLTPSAHWADDGTGNWVIDNGGSPVLFWQSRSDNQSNPAMSLNVDTDDLDATKLMISVSQKVGNASTVTELGRVRGIPRHTMIPITIEAFLDERPTASGGKGHLRVVVNNVLAADKVGPTLSSGKYTHDWSLETYLWNEPAPYNYSRATYYKTARMLVFPASAPACGDGTCNGSETCSSCSADCGACPPSSDMPASEVTYPGASATKPFVATEPYVLNIQGTSTTVSLGGAARGNDFGGAAPFVNPQTGRNDPFVFQAWSSGLVDWYGSRITNAGVPGRIDKQTFNGEAVTAIKYNAGDDIAYEKCRTKVGSFPVPPRTHVRWELEVAFGKADGQNDWTLTPSTHWGQDSSGNWIIDNGGSPVLFWALTSASQSNGPLGLDVDTDNLDPTRLMISVGQRVGTAAAKTELARVHGLDRHVMIPIVIEAFLDERPTASGGKGLLRIWVNGTLAVEKRGPTLALGSGTHLWAITTYLWNEPAPYRYSRAAYFKRARMLVFP